MVLSGRCKPGSSYEAHDTNAGEGRVVPGLLVFWFAKGVDLETFPEVDIYRCPIHQGARGPCTRGISCEGRILPALQTSPTSSLCEEDGLWNRMAERTGIKRFMQGCLSNLSVLQPLRTPGGGPNPRAAHPPIPQTAFVEEEQLRTARK